MRTFLSDCSKEKEEEKEMTTETKIGYEVQREVIKGRWFPLYSTDDFKDAENNLGVSRLASNLPSRLVKITTTTEVLDL